MDARTRRSALQALRRAEGALLRPEALPEEVQAELPGAREALTSAIGDARIEPAFAERLAALERATDAGPGSASARDYVDRHGVRGVVRFKTAGASTRLYELPVETFPGHVNNVYLIVDGELRCLFDVGSGTPTSRRDLAAGLAIVREAFGEAVQLEQIDLAIVSHAHIDHFGGALDLREKSRALLLVHELDARVLAAFEERIVIAERNLDVYMRRAGVEDAVRQELIAMYGFSKQLFRSVEPDRRLRDGDLVAGGYRVHHVPGHCPGLICLQVHDVLLTADHVLSRITPNQMPESITPFTGLEHYFRSLGKVRKLEGVDLALGGHEEPITDLRSRVDEITMFHLKRLDRVREICREGAHSVAGLSFALFGAQVGYGRLLALTEAGAHVEYLHGRGELRIANLSEVAARDDAVILYCLR
ncbi:MAG: MBL fold metallo-hydrolase [Deltaproteobacteria bacterium]|nr:MBL fold metallo-hydrolase [Deltaproteobacteria bacterium]